MGKHTASLAVGAVMIVGGLVLFFAFRDVETPIVGLRQAGVVIAALGAIEVAVTCWSLVGSRRRQHGR